MLLELQRRLLRRKFWRSRIIFLTIALTALCSGIILCWPLAAAPLFNAEPAAEEADQGQESEKQSNPLNPAKAWRSLRKRRSCWPGPCTAKPGAKASRARWPWRQ